MIHNNDHISCAFLQKRVYKNVRWGNLHLCHLCLIFRSPFFTMSDNLLIQLQKEKLKKKKKILWFIYSRIIENNNF